ncbi:MAG: helix-turn-helix domain-containing protein [Flavobacteriaceae bacterium]|nr:helix-turn-helix domain-containing protein [Flavobacteriaceae bacterium]
MKAKLYLITIFLSLFQYAQEPALSIENTYTELDSAIRKFDEDDVSAFTYINLLIKKAKTEKDYWWLYKAYRTAAAYAPEDEELKYGDSCLWAAKHTTDSLLLGNAYLTYGLTFNSKRQYDKALAHYLIAEKYLYNTDDTFTKYKLLTAIGLIKNYVELFDEAIPLLDSSNTYYSKLETRNDSAFYLRTLIELKDTHTDLGKYEKASQMYHQGKALNASYKDATIEAFLDLYEGYNQYRQKNYAQAIDLVQSAIPQLYKKEDFSRIAMGDFYLGSIYFDMGEKEKGISYFKKMDSVFVKENYTRPRFREAYEKMLTYYEGENMPFEQLWAVNQLLAVDQTLNTYFKNISTRLKNEYDTQQLLREKEQIEKNFEAESKRSFYGLAGIIALSLLVLGLGVYSLRLRARYKKQYDQLLNATITEEKSEEVLTENIIEITKSTQNKISISNEVTQDILQKLQEFENQQQFLESNLTQNKLAKSFNTNATYLAQIIKNEKGITYAKYINQLRIKYLINQFKRDAKYKNYTITGLAEEFGFNNSKTLRNAFKEVSGIPFSYFIDQFAKETV